MAGFVAENIITDKVEIFHWNQVDEIINDKDKIFIDVRTNLEYENGHINVFINIPVDELSKVNEDLAGKFFGIGIEFNIIGDTLNVTHVLKDGPSFKAGIETGDKLIKVNDSSIAGIKINIDKIRKLLRGDKGTTVSLTLLRNGNEKIVTVTRDAIPLSSIDANYMIANGIGYIKLNKFSQETYREFMRAMEDMQKQGLKKLILDLRGNGGGILDNAIEIADEFIDGNKLITYTEGKHLKKKEYKCAINL